MRTVAAGQVERAIWWNGTETIALDITFVSSRSLGSVRVSSYSETLLTAMLRVNSVEKAIRISDSRVASLESLKWPVKRSAEHPIDVDTECMTVRSHGALICLESEGAVVKWATAAYLLQDALVGEGEAEIQEKVQR